jgi:hypothetical protein
VQLLVFLEICDRAIKNMAARACELLAGEHHRTQYVKISLFEPLSKTEHVTV